LSLHDASSYVNIHIVGNILTQETNMTKLETLTEILLAAWIFVSGYFILIAASVICEAQLIDINAPGPLAEQPSLFGQYSQQPIIAPIVPIVPGYVPPANIPVNPYGTGYSVVTTERVGPDYVQQYLGNRNAVTHTTVTSVVPNNAWGQPIRPINPYWP